MMGFHLPAAIWGALSELCSWEGPLTPLENKLRHQAAQAGYEGGFIEHYLLPILYPDGLRHGTQVILGSLVVVLNALIYLWILWRSRGKVKGPASAPRAHNL
jgi:hypothetical protein